MAGGRELDWVAVVVIQARKGSYFNSGEVGMERIELLRGTLIKTWLLRIGEMGVEWVGNKKTWRKITFSRSYAVTFPTYSKQISMAFQNL